MLRGHAVFTEQGSSASRMTVAKVMDVMARLPECDGQAHSGKNWRTLPDCSKFQSQNVQTYAYVFHDMNGRNPGKTLKIPWFFLNEIYTDTHWRDCYGKDNSKKLYLNLDWKKYQIGNVCSFIENKGYFSQYMWMTSTWLRRSRIWLPCGRN